MKEIEEIYEDMKTMVGQIESDDVVEEVEEEYAIYDTNTKLLLNSSDIDEFLSTYDTICQSQEGVLECFEFTSADKLREYIEENEISFDELKIETARASYEALENIIFEVDEDY
jgi:hypothetical protein